MCKDTNFIEYTDKMAVFLSNILDKIAAFLSNIHDKMNMSFLL